MFILLNLKSVTNDFTVESIYKVMLNILLIQVGFAKAEIEKTFISFETYGIGSVFVGCRTVVFVQLIKSLFHY